MTAGKPLMSLVLGVLVFLVAPELLLAGTPAEALPDAPSATQAVVEPEAAVESYLCWFFRRTDGRSLAKAKEHVPAVVAAAQKEGLDPLLVAVIIAYESTWSPKALGGVGEVGLMQVHGLATEGFDVTTVEGNLAAGCRWLASRIQRCGSVEAGVAAYIGQGERARKSGKFRIQRYREEQKRQGLEQIPLLV